MIRFPDRDPTGFCKSQPDPDRTGFRKKLYRIRNGYPNCGDHCRQMLNQRKFSDINRIGSNIWAVDYITGLGSDWITQWKYWNGLGSKNSPIRSTLRYSLLER